MSASAFSFDDWEGLLASSAPTVDTLASTPTTSTSSPSGEFQPFTAVGVAVAGGGGRKSVSLFFGGHVGEVCSGTIGKSKFCIKPGTGDTLIAPPDGCQVQAHGTHKFPVDKDSFYVKENDAKAFMKPVFSAPGIPIGAVEAILQQTLTLKEWEMFFDDLGQGIFPEWLQPHMSALEVVPEGEIFEGNLLHSVPSLSFEEDSTNSKDTEGEQGVWIKEFKRRFTSIKLKWGKAFTDIEANHLLVVKDLQASSATILASQLGTMQPNETMAQGSTVWSALTGLARSMAEHSSSLVVATESVQDLKQQIMELAEAQESGQAQSASRLQMLERCAQVFESRFNKILPIVLAVKNQAGSTATKPNNEIEVLREQVRHLTATVDSLKSALWDSDSLPGPAVPARTNDTSTLHDIQAQIKALQLQVVGGGVRIGAKIFQSFDMVETWIKTDLPNQCYGLFVDAVSLLDFFSCIGHVDADKTFAAFHSQQKTGFTSMYEARVAASIQNVFPMVFGRSSSSGMDDSEYIPAIQDPAKWDNGVTGIKHQITRGMADVEYQLESAIDTVLGPYPEARQIAKECLFKSKQFVTDLCHFISTDFNKWRIRGHGQKDAWQMTAVSVRRVFEEIHSERVVARDIYDYKDSTFSSAKFLWATWKAHQVMDRYIKHQFYEHPSIAAVLARHLADNYVKPDDTLANKVNKMEKDHKALVTRVDTLSSKDKDTRHKSEKNDKARVNFAS
jgi:hypothetical protein